MDEPTLSTTAPGNASAEFVEDVRVLGAARTRARHRRATLSPIFSAERVRLSDQPVPLPADFPGAEDQIQVDVVREGGRITRLQIFCPCGRKAELDCEYEQP